MRRRRCQQRSRSADPLQPWEVLREVLGCTETEAKVLEVVKDGLATCTEVGEAVWGRSGRNPQTWARTAGAVLHRLMRRGLVANRLDLRSGRLEWYLLTRT